MSKSTDSKIYGLRLPVSKIEEFNQACHSLPLLFKPSKLLLSYIDYIISVSNEYKKTGFIKLGFIGLNENIVLIEMDGKQTSFNFDDMEKDLGVDNGW